MRAWMLGTHQNMISKRPRSTSILADITWDRHPCWHGSPDRKIAQEILDSLCAEKPLMPIQRRFVLRCVSSFQAPMFLSHVFHMSFTCSHEVYEVSFAVVATGDLQALVAWSY